MTITRSRLIFLLPLLYIFLLPVSSSPSHAQLETLAGNFENGEGISEVCTACHGSDGMGYPEGTPRLAGQTTKYLVRQLFQLRQSARARLGLDLGFDSSQIIMTGASKMRSVARSFDGMDDAISFLDDQDIVDIAAYFNGLNCKPSEKPRVVAPVMIARCKFCHGVNGNKSSATVPNLASQKAIYIRRQLKFFRATPKLSDELLTEDTFRFSRVMHTNAKLLTADNITAVSEYYSAEPCK